MKNQGFTLIELLVVVLIIGILAAIAVPQYRMTVDKTQIMKLLPLARAIKNAQETFYLANGRYAKNWDELGFDLPAFLKVSGGRAYSFNGSGRNLRINFDGQERFLIGPYRPDFVLGWPYD